MKKAFTTLIDSTFSFLKDKPVLVAVSGGLDSTVLAHLCQEAGLDFAIAHCNFKLRGSESDADAIFVSEMASGFSKEVFVQAFDNNSNKITSILKITKNDLKKNFPSEEYFAVINTLQKGITHLKNFYLIERSFEDMSLDLMLSLKKKKLKLSKLKDINYFSEPAAEKVKSSWYMKKIK